MSRLEEYKRLREIDPEKAEEMLYQQQMMNKLQSSREIPEEDGYQASRGIASDDSAEAESEDSESESDSEGSKKDEFGKKDIAQLGIQAGALGLKAYQGSKERQERRDIAEYEARLKRNMAMQNAAASGHNWFR